MKHVLDLVRYQVTTQPAWWFKLGSPKSLFSQTGSSNYASLGETDMEYSIVAGALQQAIRFGTCRFERIVSQGKSTYRSRNANRQVTLHSRTLNRCRGNAGSLSHGTRQLGPSSGAITKNHWPRIGCVVAESRFKPCVVATGHGSQSVRSRTVGDS